MTTRSKLISNALMERFRELCDERVPGLGSVEFGCGVMPFVERVRERLRSATPASLKGARASVKWPTKWCGPGEDYPTAFRPLIFALALGTPLQLDRSEHPPVASFMELLAAPLLDSAQRVRLLMYRYSCPLNFTLGDEDIVREYVLRRLMTRERSLIEKGSAEGAGADELLVMLNLVAVHALREPDLRFLDALNYYYELLPAGWQRSAGEQGVLLASYFALYARALAKWILEDN